MGRRLCGQGEAVFEIVVAGGGVELLEASTWSIDGVERWRYELTTSAPSGVMTRYRPADAVIHVQYGRDKEQPWTAAGPFDRSGTTTTAAKRLEISLATEGKRPTGAVLPVPTIEGTDRLQADLKTLDGAAVMVPSTIGGWDVEGTNAGRADWNPNRMGPEYHENIPPVRQGLSDHVSAAAGVPPPLIRGDSDGTGLREAWRQFLHATIQPVARIISGELAMKLDTPDLTLSFDRLMASDLQGRARSFQSMVGGGMDVTKAAMLAGLMESE